ncbi:ATP-binding protein [Amycolatopsis azurea]|uniref:ATP-binding protein n=1 Tax=Amycolatopsis azurea DSM 43854 TaxID=1238180 RepID=M2NTX5_9PSEU|nr:ATP-binding protein [Amycolatopsis azurea]EMD25919.1 putative PAS and GAF domain protein [Amycolatopsis azurea DSM 43854]OOC05806.1 ATP-binding protein [Amycolatopsis azurea DSM 43854]
MTSSDATVRQDTRISEFGMADGLNGLAEVRAWTRTTLSGLPADTIADVVMVVDELSSNALRHARAPYLVRLRRSGDSLRVEVEDGASATPARPGPPTGTGGHGLTLVALSTTAWGQTARPDGKTVWAEFELGTADD